MTEVCDLSLWLSFMVQICDFNITVNSNDSLFDLALWFSSTVMFNHVITPIYSIWTDSAKMWFILVKVFFKSVKAR